MPDMLTNPTLPRKVLPPVRKSMTHKFWKSYMVRIITAAMQPRAPYANPVLAG